MKLPRVTSAGGLFAVIEREDPDMVRAACAYAPIVIVAHPTMVGVVRESAPAALCLGYLHTWGVRPYMLHYATALNTPGALLTNSLGEILRVGEDMLVADPTGTAWAEVLAGAIFGDGPFLDATLDNPLAWGPPSGDDFDLEDWPSRVIVGVDRVNRLSGNSAVVNSVTYPDGPMAFRVAMGGMAEDFTTHAWDANMNAILALQRTPTKPILCLAHGTPGEEPWATFNLASYLLLSDYRTWYAYQADDLSLGVDYRETFTQLGKPSQYFTEIIEAKRGDGSYRRTFKNGYAEVNPTTGIGVVHIRQ